MCLLCGWCVCVCLDRSQRAAVMHLLCGDRGEGVGGRGRKEEIAFVTATHSAPGCLLLLFYLHRGCRWLDVCVVAAIGVHVAYNRTRSMQHSAGHAASSPSASVCASPSLVPFYHPPCSLSSCMVRRFLWFFMLGDRRSCHPHRILNQATRDQIRPLIEATTTPPRSLLC